MPQLEKMIAFCALTNPKCFLFALLIVTVRAIFRAHPPDFFVNDAYRMDRLPNDVPELPNCHQKCKWHCEGLTTSCKVACVPTCQPPRCVTSCQKVDMSLCHQVCKDPHCAVLCPSNATTDCEKRVCPKCKTLCGESECQLECQNPVCESHCAAPQCTWNCTRDASCHPSEPICSLNCENSEGCSLSKNKLLPDPKYAMHFGGQDTTWSGLADVPDNISVPK